MCQPASQIARRALWPWVLIARANLLRDTTMCIACTDRPATCGWRGRRATSRVGVGPIIGRHLLRWAREQTPLLAVMCTPRCDYSTVGLGEAKSIGNNT